MSTDRATTASETVPAVWTELDEAFFVAVGDVLSTEFLWGAATLLASLLLARTIAGPMRRLSAVAENVSRNIKARDELPELANRVDEVGRRRLANRFPDAPQISAETGEGVRTQVRDEDVGRREQLVHRCPPLVGEQVEPLFVLPRVEQIGFEIQQVFHFVLEKEFVEAALQQRFLGHGRHQIRSSSQLCASMNSAQRR